MLLVFGTPCQLRSLAGQEHGRTIPLCEQIAQQVSDFGAKEIYEQQAQKWRAMAAQAERIKSEEQEA